MENNKKENHHHQSQLDDCHPNNTYIAGEDDSRLQQVAHEFGLSSNDVRIPQPNIRLLQLFWKDDTLERSRMHCVGALGRNEHIDDFGNVHLTCTIKKKNKRRQTRGRRQRPDYGGDLSNLFQTLDSQVSTEEQEQLEDEDEEDEEEVIDVVEGGSLTAAIFGIIKGTIGGAILFLPKGFQMAGYACAIPTMILATASYLYSANRLLECWRIEKDRTLKIDEIRALLLESSSPKHQYYYGSTTTAQDDNDDSPQKISNNTEGGGKLLTYPELARRSLGNAAVFVQLGIAVMQFGVCLTYLIFVPQNLYEATIELFGWEVSKTYFLVAMVLIEIPMSWIRDIRRLTPFNVLATLLIAYGLLSCLMLAFWEIASDPELSCVDRLAALPPINKETWIVFIGTAFFSFEGTITLIVPLQEAVFLERDKKRFPSVNQTVTCAIVGLYIFFAMTCWAAFGSSIRTALTASLPPGPYVTSVQLAYSIALVFTFPLQAFPAMEVVFHHFTSGVFKTDPSEYTKLNIGASVVVCMLGIIAYVAIDYLGNVVSLLGSLVGIPIALIFPPIMHNMVGRNLSLTARIMNYLVASLGVVVMVVTSYTTIIQWDKGAE